MSIRPSGAIAFERPLAHAFAMSDETALLAANRAYYRAFSGCDFEAMSELWGTGEISCVHPGWPALIGRDAVLASYREIMRNPSQEPIEFRSERTLIAATEGRVFCVEVVAGVALMATNWFKLAHGAWSLVHHQASPLASFSETSERTRSLH